MIKRILLPATFVALFSGVIANLPADRPTVLWGRTADDSVAARRSSSPPAARGDGSGYATAVHSTLKMFTVRLSPGSESIRDHVMASAAEINGASGIQVEVAPDSADFTESPPEGEIRVTVSDNSPCGPLGSTTLGCGGYQYRDDAGRRTVVAGVVWIAPNLERRGGSVLRDTVLHEFGHAFGLEHYDAPYQGRHQVMRSVVGADVRSYQPGDRAGFAHLGGAG